MKGKGSKVNRIVSGFASTARSGKGKNIESLYKPQKCKADEIAQTPRKGK